MSWCEKCRNITFAEPRREEGPFNLWGVSYQLITSTILQPSARALHDSAANGCPLCRRFWTALSRHGQESIDKIQPTYTDESPVVYNFYFLEKDHDWLFDGVAKIECGKTLRFYPPKLPVPGNLLQLFARSYYAMPHERALENINTKEPDDHTGSDVNLELARCWVQDCLLRHDTCAMSSTQQTPSMLPTRVIDVTDLAHPYLLDTQDEREDYLTLSYCWGQSKRLLTTTQNYPAYKTMLPTDERMPLTFSEAFTVTKTLGFRYIWIDALCILQDDPLDVNREMARMGEIYMNSTVTIFAGKGPDADSGLFARRDGALRKPCNAFVTTQERGKRHVRQIAFVDDQYDYHSPLDDRGWVLQEEILARTHLVFTPHEIQWTCRTGRLCEARPYKARDYGHDGPQDFVTVARRSMNAMRLMMANPGLFNRTKGALENPEEHFDIWYNVLSRYSHRHLTIPSDKLSTLGGIAQLMQKNFDCSYGAGLWKEDLQRGLCWRTASSFAHDLDPAAAHNEPSQLPKQEYIAPSWSWASIRDRGISHVRPSVNWRGELLEQCIQFIDWSFSYPPEAVVPFGRLKSGVLTLWGHVRKALLLPDHAERKAHIYHKPLWSAAATDADTGSDLGRVALDTPGVYRYLNNLDLGYEEHEFGFIDKLPSGGLPVSCLNTYI